MRHLLLATAAIGVMAACAKDPKPTITALQPASAHSAHIRADNGDLTAEQKQAVAEVRNATALFQSIGVAQNAGYSTQYPPGCAETPAGAQAFHYLNQGLVDDKVELLKPELVMYEPQPDGSMQLIGVDYVVPLTASQDPPTLLGVPFMRNEALGVWALHIWAWRPNPSGMFAPWNPNASCKYAN